LFHFVQAADLALIHRQFKAVPVENLDRQGDFRPVSALGSIADGVVVDLDFISCRAFLRWQDVHPDLLQCGEDP